MIDEGIRRAQDAIEERLAKQERPIRAGLLLKIIREEGEDVRDIDLREAVWILIGSGKIILTPQRELTLNSESELSPVVK